MENREVTRFWDCTDVQRPRRPNSNQTSISLTQSHKEDAESILAKTSLRVDAKEWFPSSYAAAVSHSTAQSRLRNIKENNIPPEETYNNPVPEHDEDIALHTSRLAEIIKSLTYDPGQFDNLVEMFMAVLSPYLEDVTIASNATDLIFNQALCEPSFRYNAARLSSVIDEHCSLFRPRLHTLCEKELQTNNCKQGLTLFLAELYMQLHHENSYGPSLLTSLKNLISLGKVEDVKCICHTLKLAGSSLEMYDKKALDAIFLKLVEIRSHESMPSLNGLLDSVFELRKNQWGHNTPGTPTNSFPPEQNGYIPTTDDGFILYGPDGQEITPEERDFLRLNCEDPNDFLGEESSDPDELYDPEPEMDEEIQAAFRDFVKMSKR